MKRVILLVSYYKGLEDGDSGIVLDECEWSEESFIKFDKDGSERWIENYNLAEEE